jgi:hypothetical protein
LLFPDLDLWKTSRLLIVSLLARRNVDQLAGFSTAQAVLFH